MPLPEQAGSIAGLAKQAGKRREVGIKRLDLVALFGIATNPVDVGIAARQHRPPARRAQRVRAEGVLEPHTLVGKPVHVGCPEDRVPGAAHLLRLLVVGHDEQNVGARVIRPGAAARRESRSDRPKALQSLAAGRSQGSRAGHYRTSVPNDTRFASLATLQDSREDTSNSLSE